MYGLRYTPYKYNLNNNIDFHGLECGNRFCRYMLPEQEIQILC